MPTRVGLIGVVKRNSCEWIVFSICALVSILNVIKLDEHQFFSSSSIEICAFNVVLAISIIINFKLKNIFADIVHIVLIIFYLIRLQALIFFPISSPIFLDLSLENPEIIPEIIQVLVIYSCYLLAAIYIFSKKNFQYSQLTGVNSSEKVIKILIFLSLLPIIYDIYLVSISLFNCSGNLSGGEGALYNIVTTIFDSWRAIFILIPILIIFSGRLTKPWIILIYIGIFGFVMTSMLQGQKSGGLQLVLAFLISAVVGYRIGLPLSARRLVSICICFIVLAAIAFPVGKITRNITLNQVGCETSKRDFASVFDPVRITTGLASHENRYNLDFGSNDVIYNLMDSASERAGYIDFFAEKYSSESYRSVVTGTAYFRAIVDKLSPGFDIYDQPFVSRLIYYARHGGDASLQTNSEQLTVFGEAFLLFGKFSWLYFLVFGFIFSASMKFVIDFSAMSSALKIFFLLYLVQLFYYWLEGMGLDMLFVIYGLHNSIYMTTMIALAYHLARYWVTPFERVA